MRRRYAEADTLLFICYCWRSKFTMFRHEYINILVTPYFMVLDSMWSVGTQHEQAPNLSYPLGIYKEKWKLFENLYQLTFD